MSTDSFFLIFSIAWGSALLPLIVYFVKVKKPSKAIRIIAVALLASVLFDGLGYGTARYFRSNVITNNVYHILSVFLLSWFYVEILFKKNYKFVLLAGTAVYILSFVSITLFLQHFLKVHQTFAWSMGNLVLVMYAAVYMHHLVVTLPTDNLNTFGLVWINTGILICKGFAICIFLVSEYNFRALPAERTIVVWSLFNLSSIVQHVLFAIGIYYSRVSERVTPVRQPNKDLVNGKGVLASGYAAPPPKTEE